MVLGLVLIGIAAVIILIAAVSLADDSFQVGMLGMEFEANALVVYLAGVITVLLLWLGWFILRRSIAEQRRKHRDAREIARLSERLSAAEKQRAADEAES